MAEKLTDKNVGNFKPTNVRQEIPDGGFPGLFLVIQPTGSRSWAYRYRTKGNTTPRKLTLGPALDAQQAHQLIENGQFLPEHFRNPVFDFPMLLSGARALAKLAADHARQGTDPASLKKRSKAESTTVEAAIKAFVERPARLRRKTRVEVARILRFAPASKDSATFETIADSPLWRGRSIESISGSDVSALLNAITKPVMANRTLSVLSQFFGWCVERDLRTSNPCNGIEKPHEEVSRERVLSPVELARLWKVAQHEPYPFGPILLLLILTGQRREEVAGMRWSELDFTGNFWTIPAERAKNARPNDVPLTQAVTTILQGLPRHAGSDLVFTQTGVTSVSGFSRLKRRLDGKLADVPHWTIHDIRRTIVSGMASIGVPLVVIEKLVNHVSGSLRGVAGVYQRYEYRPEKIEAINRWSLLVKSLGDGQSKLGRHW